MKKGIRAILAAACLTVSSGLVTHLSWADEKPAEKPKVQIAILLDTSGSMGGLIDQARTQLWSIVNEFATAKQNGQSPDLQVALYQYGSPTLGEENGYVRQIVAFTDDLDKVSQELFALHTDGGDEYCGTVIAKAVDQLQWSADNEDYKAIFIAGNEPFTQGQIDYKQSCKDAITRGIIVNTIHCGTEQEGISGSWKDGSLVADGSFLNIDQDQKTIYVAAPQDAEIEELGKKLNETYIAYGEAGEAGAENQMAQDANAASASPAAAVARSVSKSSRLYKTDWDLASSVKDGDVKLEEVEEKDLPEELRALPAEKRQEYIDQKLAERETLQKRIAELNKERTVFVSAEMERLVNESGGTLDQVMIPTVRKQAEARDFVFGAE